MRRIPCSALIALVALAAACGGNQPAESPDTTASDTKAAGETPEDSKPSPPAERGEQPEAWVESEQKDDKLPRTVKYIMTTAGLEIEVEGVRFTPKATPIKVGAGWGVRIVVDAKVIDDTAHSLLDPKNGPLAFAGSVDRGGEVLRIGDKREGEGEKLIGPGEKVKLERDWPGKTGDKPVTAGQSVALEVGLWGLGPDADQRRAVRDFFQVKLRVGDKGKPQPVISPPPSANP